MKLFGTKEIGALGEKIAARYLRRQGYRILGKNLRYGHKELDLIAKNRECIAFVEVKTLAFDTVDEADRHPARAVNMEKRKNTVQAARLYLREHPTRLCPRLDVIEVYLDRSKCMKPFKINHIPAAFDASGKIH